MYSAVAVPPTQEACYKGSSVFITFYSTWHFFNKHNLRSLPVWKEIFIFQLSWLIKWFCLFTYYHYFYLVYCSHFTHNTTEDMYQCVRGTNISYNSVKFEIYVYIAKNAPPLCFQKNLVFQVEILGLTGKTSGFGPIQGFSTVSSSDSFSPSLTDIHTKLSQRNMYHEPKKQNWMIIKSYVL